MNNTTDVIPLVGYPRLCKSLRSACAYFWKNNYEQQGEMVLFDNIICELEDLLGQYRQARSDRAEAQAEYERIRSAIR